MTIHLDCRKSGERYVRELHLLRDCLETLGGDNYLVTYKPD